MLPLITGFMIGGFMGFLMCGVLHINRVQQSDYSNGAMPRDRRCQSETVFPLTDCDGVQVYADRRMQPERRFYGTASST